MLDWLKNINKEYPEFWKSYLAKFEKKPEHYAVLHCDLSGSSPVNDVIYGLSTIGVVKDQVIISDLFDVVLLQYKYLHDNGLSNTFLIESKSVKMAEPQAIEAFVNHIGNAILVGYRINIVVELINEALDRLGCGRLKNEALDVEIMFRKWKDIGDRNIPLEDLYKEFKLAIPDKATTLETTYDIALIFLKLKSRLGLK